MYLFSALLMLCFNQKYIFLVFVSNFKPLVALGNDALRIGILYIKSGLANLLLHFLYNCSLRDYARLIQNKKLSRTPCFLNTILLLYLRTHCYAPSPVWSPILLCFVFLLFLHFSFTIQVSIQDWPVIPHINHWNTSSVLILPCYVYTNPACLLFIS